MNFRVFRVGILACFGAGWGCAEEGGSPSNKVRPPAVENGVAWSLGGPSLPLVELVLGETAGAQDIQDTLTVRTPWTSLGFDRAGRVRWGTSLPFRPRGLFFHRVEPGLVLAWDGEPLVYRRGGVNPQASWAHDQDRLELMLPVGQGPPEPGSVTLTYPLSAERERRLSPKASGLDSEAFAQAQVRHGEETHQGWLLPAPSHAKFDVTIPPSAEWVMSPGLVEPEWASGSVSDGARLVLELETAEGVTSVWSRELQPGKFDPVRVDLSSWEGVSGRLVLRSEVTGSGQADHVFLGQPRLVSRKANPRRVFMVFMDTVRPDHLSLYGAERDTSVALEGWGSSAVVFDAARTVAPWTLPSARSVMTGRHPEAYAGALTLGEHLSGQGWATAMFAGNVYLSSNFDMNRGWGLHRVALWPQATAVVDQALAWLDAHDGMDVLIQVQFMEAHLPYDEPDAYRTLYAGASPEALREGFHLSDVRRAGNLTETDRQYVRDRYDNNLRYMTDEMGRLLSRVGPDDVVVIYGDHGEEFWEHGGFEHGHTVFEELLRVPLVIDGPGIEGLRVDSPVSLVDIMPTVLELLDMTAEGFDGVSLVGAMRGEEGAKESLEGRALSFGRPLYGMERWGVLDGSEKWSTTSGLDHLVDLVLDPEERGDRAAPVDSKIYAARLGDDLGCPVEAGLRLVNIEGKQAPKADLEVELRWGTGLKAVVLGADPLESGAVDVSHKDGSEMARILWPAGHRGSREVYFVPGEGSSFDRPSSFPQLDVTLGKISHSVTVDMNSPDRLLLDLPLAARRIQATRAWVPLCEEESIRGTDSEMRDALEAMGYVDSEG